MNNELSKQICALCGIEPIKLLVCPNCGYYKGNPEKINNHRDKVKLYTDGVISCSHCSTSVAKEDVEINYKEIYPDFIEPDNFVKLLWTNVKDEETTIFELVYDTLNVYESLWIPKDTTRFLDVILSFLLDEKSLFEITHLVGVNDIKQAIKAEEWEVWG